LQEEVIMLEKYLLLGIFIAAFSFSLTGAEAEPKAPAKKIIRYEPEKEKHYKLIPLGASSFEAVSPIIKAMMSKDGILTNEDGRKSVLVYDSDEVIRKVSDFLRQIDMNIVNIRIDVDFTGSGSGSDDAIIVRPDYGGKPKRPQPWAVNKKPKNVDINMINRRTTTTSNSSQFVLTKSGSPASIWVGKTMIDPSWLRAAIQRPDIIIVSPGSITRIDSPDTDIKWADVGASLEVLPTYYEDGTIEVELYPSVSCLDGKGRKRSVKVQQLSTKVRVKSGQRIFIGGLGSGKKEMYTKLFGPDFFSRKDGVDVTNIYLTATAVNSGGGIISSSRPGK